MYQFVHLEIVRRLQLSSTRQEHLSFRQFKKTNAVKYGRIMKWMNTQRTEKIYVLLNNSPFLATHNKGRKKVIEETAMFCHNQVNS